MEGVEEGLEAAEEVEYEQAESWSRYKTTTGTTPKAKAPKQVQQALQTRAKTVRDSERKSVQEERDRLQQLAMSKVQQMKKKLLQRRGTSRRGAAKRGLHRLRSRSQLPQQ